MKKKTPKGGKPNAKFWIWHHEGFVRLKLAPGTGIEYGRGGPTEEGFYSRSDSYYYNDDRMVIEAVLIEDSRDCDGPHRYTNKCECSIENLQHHEHSELWGKEPVRVIDGRYQLRDQHYKVGSFDYDYPKPPMPLWERRVSRQRDYFAEAMGY